MGRSGLRIEVQVIEETREYSCAVCKEDTMFIFLEAERGDRDQPGWEACWQCLECDEYTIDLWEIDND